MQEIGVVDSVNEKRGTVKVVFDRKSACDKCGMCLTSKGEKMKVYVEVKNTLGAKVGDRVGVTMSDRFVLRAAFIVYIIPVALVGAGLAIFRKLPDIWLLAVIGVGLLLGVGIGILADRLIRKKASFAPSLSGIYPPESETVDPSANGKVNETNVSETSEESSYDKESKIQ